MRRSAFLLAVPVLLAGLAGCDRPATTPSPTAVAALVPKPGCIFCKIIAGTSPSKKVYEDDRVLAFWDIAPRAKVHVLVIPKQHVESMRELELLPMESRAALLSACLKVAQDQGLTEAGFRIITNAGKDASQSVFHLHFHVVGGEKLPEDAVRVKPKEAK
ncbi:MAG: histidine triad nucleotide-binding protein [Holophagaceae bacterium]|nr:histidine triad nucleotide-binding protein [Holophagaceae bacterium]